MTNKEREQLRLAIRMIHDGDDHWDQGMRMLLKLAKMRWPAQEVVFDASPVPLEEIAKGPDREFQVLDDKSKRDEKILHNSMERLFGEW